MFLFLFVFDGKYPRNVEPKMNVTLKKITGCFRDKGFFCHAG